MPTGECQGRGTPALSSQAPPHRLENERSVVVRTDNDSARPCAIAAGPRALRKADSTGRPA